MMEPHKARAGSISSAIIGIFYSKQCPNCVVGKQPLSSPGRAANKDYETLRSDQGRTPDGMVVGRFGLVYGDPGICCTYRLHR